MGLGLKTRVGSLESEQASKGRDEKSTRERRMGGQFRYWAALSRKSVCSAKECPEFRDKQAARCSSYSVAGGQHQVVAWGMSKGEATAEEKIQEGKCRAAAASPVLTGSLSWLKKTASRDFVVTGLLQKVASLHCKPTFVSGRGTSRPDLRSTNWVLFASPLPGSYILYPRDG